MSSVRESLCDLIETRSALHCIARRRLWTWVFAAALEGTLTLEFPNDVSTDADDRARLRHAIADALRAVQERGADPSKWNWVRSLVLSQAAFDKWLKGALRHHEAPVHSKRKAGAKPSPREKVKKFVDETFPDGVPPAITHEEIARRAEPTVGKRVSPRTVSRALGRK
jgi:hypothetical protein